MTDFRMPDAWYEPEDEIEIHKECRDGCGIEDDHERPSECYTAEDAREDEAERRREVERDMEYDFAAHCEGYE